jgi:carbon starvation protein CstA
MFFTEHLLKKIFGIDTIAQSSLHKQDGRGLQSYPLWENFLFSFINIAGTGPIFGAIGGILLAPQTICG